MRWLSRVFGGDTRAPRDVDSALRAALLSVLERDWEEAERLLVAAARFDSSAVEPYLALARLCRQRGEIGFAVRMLVLRSGQRRLEKPQIANTVGAAKQRQLLGMEIENDIEIEPFNWLDHFARAL